MRAPGLLSPPVLLGGALLSSPALWRALVEDTGSPTVALTRFLVCVALCWVALSVVAALVGPPPRPEPAARDHDDADGADRAADGHAS
jgi:hypothetical protein